MTISIRDSPPTSIGEAMRHGEALLRQNVGSAAAIEARTLLLDSLGFDDYAQLIAHSQERLSAEVAQRYQQRLRQRLDGLPIAYILGWREFYGHRFKTNQAALIPRPETEELVTAALWHIPNDTPTRVIDLGTGCGAIGISIAIARPAARVILTDIANHTLNLAKENARLHGITPLHCYLSDWYSALKDETVFDVIVCNPPYIAADDPHLQQGDLRFEPNTALDGGKNGLTALTAVINQAPQYLQRGGVLLVEHGYQQAPAIRHLLAHSGFCGIRQQYDLARLDRISLAVNP